MPLPPRKERIFFVDQSGTVRQDAEIKVKDTGYRPTPEYHPTMRAVRCLTCGAVGALEFHGGINLKLGDRVMDGKPIPGTCPRCGKGTELIPLPVNDPNTKEVALFYQIQKSLDLYTERGVPVPSGGILWPEARVRAWEEHVRKQAAQA